ncbi:MAG: tRNA (adenosine(37)-N6)-threonylcarbamoyltransferase complex transferase subunit TsaD [Bacteroidota bacterium]
MTQILAIESSCDETAAAVLNGDQVLSNIISSQLDHAEYGGVIPELASRLHQQNIIRVVDKALSEAGITAQELDAVAFTQGPGLLGALLVGSSFAKAFAWGLSIPLIAVNHMEAHVLANFLNTPTPDFPFLCLTVSGGHTQLVWVTSPIEMEILGQTLDDAAGEAFDKAAKLLGLPYPGGPEIDKWAQKGDSQAFSFPKPEVGPYDFSFSGLKTSLLYRVRDGLKENSQFIQENLADLCASYQGKIIEILLEKLSFAANKQGAQHLALAGGVSANSLLRNKFQVLCDQNGWRAHIPEFAYCTDNAAMIGIAGYYKYQEKAFADWKVVPYAKLGR